MVGSVQKLEFTKTIFDNVHGFIPLTEIEYSIIDTQEFQRLRNIRQLGLLDYVFPGALHNRFNHSLGVLFIADKMVKSLQIKEKLQEPNIRQLIRLAALLHDIGHYPLSHITEDVIINDYKRRTKNIHAGLSLEPSADIDTDSPQKEEESDLKSILDLSESHRYNSEIHSANVDSDFPHHERIASIVIKQSKIKQILLDAGVSEDDIITISQIIAGSTFGLGKSIIHSELDADRFDYVLRDSKETGVTYGLFDLNQIIRHLDFYDEPDVDEESTGLYIARKGQKAVEDYLISRYFLYSTVIYQKASIGFHKMLSLVYEGLLERNLAPSYFSLIQKFDSGDLDWYYNFNDMLIVDLLKKAIKSDIQDDGYRINSNFLKECCQKIIERKPLKLVKEEQIIAEKGQSTNTFERRYHEKAVVDSIVADAGIEDYWYIKSIIKRNITSLSPFISVNDPDSYDRLKEESIRIGEKGKKPIFLVDDPTSIIRPLANQQLVIASVYSKDKDYRQKILTAMENYERSLES
mgnify:FL=1